MAGGYPCCCGGYSSGPPGCTALNLTCLQQEGQPPPTFTQVLFDVAMTGSKSWSATSTSAPNACGTCGPSFNVWRVDLSLFDGVYTMAIPSGVCSIRSTTVPSPTISTGCFSSGNTKVCGITTTMQYSPSAFGGFSKSRTTTCATTAEINVNGLLSFSWNWALNANPCSGIYLNTGGTISVLSGNGGPWPTAAQRVLAYDTLASGNWWDFTSGAVVTPPIACPNDTPGVVTKFRIKFA